MEGNVGRRESKRWVAPKTSYDGDEWGNDYDDYDYHEGVPEGEEEVDDFAKPPIDPPSTQQPEPVLEATDESSARDDAQDAASKMETPPEALGDEPAAAYTQTAVSSYAEQAEAESEGDNTIDDIYGFYENRYSRHPYVEIAADTNRASSGSVSTGLPSPESSQLHNFSALDLVPEIGVEGQDSAAYSEGQDSAAYSQDQGHVQHLRIKKHSRDASLESAHDARRDTNKSGLSAELMDLLDKLKTPTKDAEGARNDEAISDAESADIGGASAPAKELGGSASLAADDSFDPTRISHVDPDIAALYVGTSDYLERPISTYQPEMRDISDSSLRDIITPTLESEEFKPMSLENAPNSPARAVQTASAPNSAKKQQIVPDQAYAPSTQPEQEPLAASEAPTDSDYQAQLANDHAYVDGPSEMDPNGGSSSDSDSVASRPAPLMLPSERNRLQSASREPSSDRFAHNAFDNSGDERAATDGLPAATETASDHRLATPSRLDESFAATQSSTYDQSSDANQSSMYQSLDARSTGESSDRDPAAGSPSEHARVPSEVSADTDATGVTTSSTEYKDLNPSFDTQPKRSSSPDLGGSTPQPAPAISSKVKRLPQVDFAALYGQQMSSEARTTQMQQLRIREAEYSTGLETWLVATLPTVDASMTIYTNGIPPAADLNVLDLPAAAKMSNAVHHSATNTKEKLGKVGNKSKNFFANIIR